MDDIKDNVKDDIKTRLQETSKNCLDAFVTWDEKKKDPKAQEDLHAAIHELRKVSSRLEIELAISEREQMTSKPLPIPSHRSHNKGMQSAILDDNRSNNGGGHSNNSPTVQKSAPKRRRPAPRKSSE